MGLQLLKNFFRSHPLIVNSTVYGGLYVGAEFSQQLFTRKYLIQRGEVKPLDYGSLGRYLVIGSLINSNLFYFWYKWLDRKYVGTSSKIIIRKVFLDQFIMTPPLYVIFYISMSLMEGKKDILKECREKFFKTFGMSCLFWFPAQSVNFLYLPNSARVIYMGFCSFAWVNILCWIKRNRSIDE